MLTSDIAFGLRTPNKSAEKIKVKYGCVLRDLVQSDEALEEIDLQGLGFGDDATKDAFNVFDDNQADDEDISNIFGGNDDNDISSLFGTSNDDDASSLFDDKESDKE